MAWEGAPPVVRSWPWPVLLPRPRYVQSPRFQANCPCGHVGSRPRSPQWRGPASGTGPGRTLSLIHI
eukprot:14002046-Alexandrium_andersonii.AAC.1